MTSQISAARPPRLAEVTFEQLIAFTCLEWQTHPVDLVEFLEARIAEEEESLAHADPSESRMARNMLAECAQKRSILEGWKRAAAAEGISRGGDAGDSLVMVCRSMLTILAASYTSHPDFSSDWLD
jgi:Family of unknown function (DUF6221)